MIVDTASKAAELVAPYFSGDDAEIVAVVHLDGKRNLIGTTLSSAGGAADVALPVRDILASALRMGADAIIIAHNHPSGDPSPSSEDVQATRRLARSAAPAGLRLLDHLIFGGGEWRSFRELGLL